MKHATFNMQHCIIQPTAVGRLGRRTKIKLKCSSLMRGERGYVGVPMHLIAQPCIALHHLLPKSRSDPEGLPMSYGCMPGVRCMLSARCALKTLGSQRTPDASSQQKRLRTGLHDRRARCMRRLRASQLAALRGPTDHRKSLSTGRRSNERSGWWAGQGAGGRAWLCMHAISAKHGVEQIFRRYVALRTRRRSAVCTSLQQSTGTVP